MKDLQRLKRDQENTLKQVEKMIADRGTEFQEVDRNLKRITNRFESFWCNITTFLISFSLEFICFSYHNLVCMVSRMEDMQKELRETQSQEANRFMDCRDSDILHTRRKELEHLNTQVMSKVLFGTCEKSKSLKI